MKLGRIGLFLFNIFVIVILIVMIDLNYGLWRDGEISFLQFLLYSAAFIALWRVTKARGIQSALGRLFGWDPFAGMAAERRRFNAWYDAAAAGNAQRQAQRNEEARARYAAQDAAVRARTQAKNNAIWHENQARKNAGTYAGYQHANQAKKYWNDAR